MKTAVSKSGAVLMAGSDAPQHAICPVCGGVVTLRKRRLMGGGFTYFWRHGDNRHLRCQKRSTPFK